MTLSLKHTRAFTLEVQMFLLLFFVFPTLCKIIPYEKQISSSPNPNLPMATISPNFNQALFVSKAEQTLADQRTECVTLT